MSTEHKPPHIVITNPRKLWSPCRFDVVCEKCGQVMCDVCSAEHQCLQEVQLEEGKP